MIRLTLPNRMRHPHPLTRWVVLYLALATAGPAVAMEAGRGQELAPLLERARTVFGSANQPESVPLFTQIIDTLDAQTAGGAFDDAARTLLIEALSYRAEARFNLDEQEGAAEDLRRMISTDPTTQLDAARVSPRLLELFDQLYGEMVGFLDLRVFPEDAMARIDGQPVDVGSGAVALLAGPHAVTVERPGHTPALETAEVVPGTPLELDLVLERSSAVVRVFTRPVGAAVSVGLRDLGVSSGSPSPQIVFQGDAATVPQNEFSDELVVDGLAPGSYPIEVVLEGHRTYRGEMTIGALQDYRAVVMLDLAVGRVVLEGLPEGATVVIDGETVTPEAGDTADPARLTLPIGEHAIAVSDPTAGVFETTVTVEDDASVAVPIALRPVVGILSILGGDDIGARTLREGLAEALEGLGLWVVRDYASDGAAVLQDAGATIETLRTLAAGGGDDAGLLDWQAVQATVDERTPARLYVLGVLSDDLVATHADVWMWLAAPSPTLPGRVRVALDAASPASIIREALAPEVRLSRPWLGASLVVSDAVEGAVVVRITEGSPADTAGLDVGDVVRSFDGASVDDAAALEAALTGLENNATTVLAIARGGDTPEITIEIGESPVVLSLGGSPLLPAAVLMQLVATAQSATDDREWITQLNRAAVLMYVNAWEDAVRALREIRAPSGPGLSQAAVDYWLGIALTALGPTYTDTAQQALTRAANVAGATLFHNDGPLVAPRARARLGALVVAPR